VTSDTTSSRRHPDISKTDIPLTTRNVNKIISTRNINKEPVCDDSSVNDTGSYKNVGGAVCDFIYYLKLCHANL